MVAISSQVEADALTAPDREAQAPESGDNETPTVAMRLVGSGRLVLVRSGFVDCFFRSKDASGAAVGARRLFFRAEAPAVFPDLDGAAFGVELAFAEGQDTSVEFIDLEAVFRDAAAARERQPVLERGLAAWVDATSVLRSEEEFAPRHYKALAPGGALTLEAQASASLVSGLAWTSISEGRANWMGDNASSIGAETGTLPMSARTWVTAETPTTLQAVDFKTAHAENLITRSLVQHARLALARAICATEAEEAAAGVKLEARVQAARKQRSDSIEALAGVLGETLPLRTDRSGALYATFKVLAEKQGITLTAAEAPRREDDTAFDHARALARANNLRYRDVTLSDGWERGDNGHLLLRSRDDTRWYALTVERNGRGKLYCPETGEAAWADETSPNEFSTSGLALYRPFPDDKITVFRLISFGLYGLRADLVTILAMGLLVGLLGLAVPIFNGMVFENVIPSGEREQMVTIGAVLLATTLSTVLFSLTQSIGLLRLESKMNASVQAAVWDRLLKLPASFFRDYTAGDLAMRVGAINAVRGALSGTTLSTIFTSLFASINLALLFYYDSKLALVALGVSFFAVLFVLVIGYFKLQYEKKIAEADGRLSGRLFELLTGINKLRTAAAETRAFYIWSSSFAHLERLRFKAALLGIVDDIFFSAYQPFATGVVFALVGFAIFNPAVEGMSIGAFVAFNAAFGAFFGGMVSLANILLGLLSLIPLLQRAKPILHSLPEETASKEILRDPKGLIEIGGVSFSYPDGPPVLKDVSLKIEPGSFVAIVGPSGSGKSTLLRLLMGFDTPASGTIHYDGRTIEHLDLGELRKSIGVVLQGGQLLAGDIFTNIAGTSKLTHEDAWEVAEMVGLDQDIRRMPMGMHTVIGDGAATLSGGQRQRILIARAIAHRPRIIFFDEATSALDNATQSIVSDSLARLKATRVVIAHRLSTIMMADRIVVLRDGEIIQQGAYDELMAEEGLFKVLASRQLT